MERIACALAHAPVDIVKEFNATYHANTNPAIAGVAVTTADGTRSDAPLTAPGPAPAPVTATVTAGQRVTLDASWLDAAAEPFPVYDIRSVSLVQRREALSVSWFATAGQFDHDVTGVAGDDPSLTVSNGWKAPAEAGKGADPTTEGVAARTQRAYRRAGFSRPTFVITRSDSPLSATRLSFVCGNSQSKWG